MAPGPPLIGANRFALLADSTTIKKKKRVKNNNKKTSLNTPFINFPELPSTNKANPKFIVLESVDKNKPLSHYSCFAVHKSIRAVSKEFQTVSELRDGNILLLVNNKSIAERFISLKELPGICRVKVKYHENLNYSKGTVYAPFLINVPDEEIVSELSPQGVVAVYKFQRKGSNEKIFPTGVILLTFDLFHTPEKMDIAWRNVRVRQYIPNPMRCKSCQLLGHTAKFCKRSPACENCNLPPHSPEACKRTQCANCSSDHPASSNKCEKFIQAKEILKIKVTQKCTMREAIKTHKTITPNLSENSPSFASIVSNTNNNIELNNTQPQNKTIVSEQFDTPTPQMQEICIPQSNSQLIKNTKSFIQSLTSHSIPTQSQVQNNNQAIDINLQHSFLNTNTNIENYLHLPSNYSLDFSHISNPDEMNAYSHINSLPPADDSTMLSDKE